MTAALALEPDDAPWVLRPMDRSNPEDVDALMYLAGVSYTRSRAGVRAGASHAGGSMTKAERESGKRDPYALEKQRTFIDAHRFIWLWLIDNADVTFAVDRESPDRVWAWLIATGDVIHAVGCKRTLIQEKLSVDIVRDLLGPRLSKHQVCSLELPQMRTRGGLAHEAIGIDRPSTWSLDPTWLLTRIPRGEAANQ